MKTSTVQNVTFDGCKNRDHTNSTRLKPIFFLYWGAILSEKLMLLLEKIQPKTESVRPMTEEEMAAQDAKTCLIISRVENRYYREGMLVQTLEAIKGIKYDLRLYSHILSCGECQLEASIDVERYGGGHGGVACLDLINNFEEMIFGDDDDDDVSDDFMGFGSPVNEEFMELWRQIPKVQDYRIGSYWTGASEDTVRFIKDRLKWATKLLLMELKAVRQYYRLLLAWNLNGNPPEPFYRLI